MGFARGGRKDQRLRAEGLSGEHTSGWPQISRGETGKVTGGLGLQGQLS